VFKKYELAIYDYLLQYMNRIYYNWTSIKCNKFCINRKSLITSGDIYIFNTLNFTSLLWKITISLYFLFDKKVCWLRDCTLWSSYKFVIKISDYTHTHSYFKYRLFEQSYETFLIINKENEYRGLYFGSSTTVDDNNKGCLPMLLVKKSHYKAYNIIYHFLVYIALKWLIIFKTLLTNCTAYTIWESILTGGPQMVPGTIHSYTCVFH